MMRRIIDVLEVLESNEEFDILYVSYQDDEGVGYGTVVRDPQGNYGDIEVEDDDYLL